MLFYVDQRGRPSVRSQDLIGNNKEGVTGMLDRRTLQVREQLRPVGELTRGPVCRACEGRHEAYKIMLQWTWRWVVNHEGHFWAQHQDIDYSDWDETLS